MSRNRFQSRHNDAPRAIASGRFRNAAPDSTRHSVGAASGSAETTSRYSRIRRYEHLFNIVNPPTLDDVEELAMSCLRRI